MANILIVISSQFGANLALAKLVETKLSSLGAKVRIRRVEIETSLPALAEIPYAISEDLKWADGFVFSSPSHTGLLTAAMKSFIDLHHDLAVNGAFLNKTFTAMATSGFAHAGQERVVDNLNAIAAAWGCLIITPSTANSTLNQLNGNPFGLSFVLDHGKIPEIENTNKAIDIHFTRYFSITKSLQKAI